MACQRHLLWFHWERHDWSRRVVATADVPMATTSQWGVSVAEPETLCRIEFHCERCGAVRGGGDCGCDPVRGDACPARLAFLAHRD